MLNKENLLCNIENEIIKIGNNKLYSIKYDKESKCGAFDIYLLKIFERILSDDYKFCNLSINEETILEIINKNINVN